MSEVYVPLKDIKDCGDIGDCCELIKEVLLNIVVVNQDTGEYFVKVLNTENPET